MMKTFTLLGILAVNAAVASAAEMGSTRASGAALPLVEVSGGTVKFAVATNVPAVSVHGESEALKGRVRVRQSPSGAALEELEAIVPVLSLKTGMSLRDEHMRKQIFTTAAGQVPDLRFVSRRGACAPAAPGQETKCRLEGELTIRGTTRPFAMLVSVSEKNGGFRVTGDGEVKLSAYSIARPSQLMVTTADVVKLQVAFVARPSGGAVASRLGAAR